MVSGTVITLLFFLEESIIFLTLRIVQRKAPSALWYKPIRQEG
jgi:hypothetical protein